ncbi:protein PHLOEM PROTEIN 2-LIKE A1-like isoform X2 [Pistacia vera]|uniref:protein PHLOEM PROTEIN 2-LIKE A1-like isoform X2 n=1 Tax=Pistacia vera TaxID=55513 RepID=UPI00126389C2|nr:protein PHLOEM PROTEIN 2-LIKE A1-like isoform X2 [Pistacia vera]
MLKFWVDMLSHKNCFMLFARELSYPKGNLFLHSIILDSSPRIDVAELQDSQSFEVKGKFNTMNLTPATLYQVSFTLMMKDEAQNGWEDPVNLKLFLPNETSEVRKEYLNKRPKNQWIEILVGTFTTTYMDSGDIEFSMYEFDINQHIKEQFDIVNSHVCWHKHIGKALLRRCEMDNTLTSYCCIGDGLIGKYSFSCEFGLEGRQEMQNTAEDCQ